MSLPPSPPDAETAAPRVLSVSAAAAGSRLDRWLAEMLAEHSRARLQTLVRGGRVLVDSATIWDPSHKLRGGETVAISIPPPTPAEPQPEAIPLAILFEDAHLIVIDKPAGLVVHPAPGSPDGTLVNALLAYCGEGLTGIGGVARPGIVHRLDKGTSGVMVVAKTERAIDGLARQFARHDIDRIYDAFVWRAPRLGSGRIETQIGRSPENRKKMAVLSSGGRTAVTEYTVLRRFGTDPLPVAAHLECRLETGRTHQIRVHLTHVGHPIIGDPTYGRGHATLKATLPEVVAGAICHLDRPALHARRLGFVHPVTGATMTFEAALPGDLQHIAELLTAV